MAAVYATEQQSSSVTDIVLSNTPAFDLDGVFIWGPLVLYGFLLVLLIWEPRRIPFVVKSIALFVIIRAVFVSVTHIGPFPLEEVFDPPSYMRMFITGADLFFSGHTGLPYLLALTFWHDWRLRSVFLSAAVLFGAVVLLVHAHYTIDVLAAFFITYTIHHIALRLFRQDSERLEHGLSQPQDVATT